ncbi:MAG: hypothetical protein CMP30_12750 [Roseibacillus sp.]|nr:hypothetical protein [Roseibacillus sp.]
MQTCEDLVFKSAQLNQPLLAHPGLKSVSSFLKNLVIAKINIIKAPGNRRNRPTISASFAQSQTEDINLQRVLTAYRIDDDSRKVAIPLFTGDDEVVAIIPKIAAKKRQPLRDYRPANDPGVAG